MLGADHRGQRLNTLYRENITEPEILAVLEPLLAAYATSRLDGEGFGDFLLRTDVVDIPEKDRRHAPIASTLVEEPA
jgi:sulfite reductase (NADPH) hemoprotein beta-component